MHSILHLSKFYLPRLGGIESAVKSITECPKLAFNHTVLTNSDHNEINKISKNISVINRKSFSIFSQPISLTYCFWYIMNRKKFSIIHLHLPNYISALLVAVFPPTNLIVHWHASIDKVHEKTFFYLLKILELRILKLSKKIIVGTKKYAKGTKILANFENKIEYIPYGCKSFNIDKIKKENILVSVGRLVSYKGYLELIEKIKIPKNWSWKIIGNGPLSEKIKTAISKKNNIELHSNLNNEQVKVFLSKSKIFLFPSLTRQESYGISQIEAMSAGCVPVNFDIPGSGVSELIDNNLNGFSVEHKNYSLFNKSISRLTSDDETFYNFSKEAIFKYKKSFTNEIFSSKISSIYMEYV